MNLARELEAIQPIARRSPWLGYEYVRGYGVFALPFDSGHVLVLRVFPQNDFAPYRTVWHRTPQGVWSIFVDSPRLDIACPRYYSAAAKRNLSARISLKWSGPMDLSIEMETPRLQWNVSMTTTPLVRLMNATSQRIPESLWRTPMMLRAFERIGGMLFDLGDVTLSGNAPNGQFSILMPSRMFPIAAASARLDGEDLGQPTRSKENPSIGEFQLPARPIFAVGHGYSKIQDPDEYERTIAELQSKVA